MHPVSDLVHLSELEVESSPDLQLTKHINYISKPGQRKVRQEEHWKRQIELGRGGFGAVYLEKCVEGGRLGTVWAVKEIRKSIELKYHRELEAIALFSHSRYEDYFVKSFGWYSTDDKIFITLEYLQHGDLHKYLGKPLPEQEAQHLVHQILQGLSFMHDKGFAHRDLKPANILVVSKGPEWWIKIADFGISKRATEGSTELRTAIGTPNFMAPEVLGLCDIDDDTSELGYTHAIDIWSTGVITFRIFTGGTPFGDARQLRRYVGGRLEFPLDTLQARQVSESGCMFTRSCMAPIPQDRPVTRELLQHPWFVNLDRPEGSQTESHNIGSLPHSTELVSRSKPVPASLEVPQEDELTFRTRSSNDPGPSAVWSTTEQDSKFTVGSHAESKLHVGGATQNEHSQSTQSPSKPKPNALLVSQKEDQTLVTYGSNDSKPFALASTNEEDSKFPAGLHAHLKPYADRVTQEWHSDQTTLGRHDSAPHGPDAADPTGPSVLISHAQTQDSWKEVKTLNGQGDVVTSVAFSPDGRLVASGSRDNTVRLWDTENGKEVRSLRRKRNAVKSLFQVADYDTFVAFPPTGQLLAASSDSKVRLWDTATWAEVKILEGHAAAVTAVAFSPDGRLLASVSWDKTVRLWDTGTWAEVSRLKGHESTVLAVAFSPDGRLLASGSYDNTVRLWDLETGVEVKRLKGHTSFVFAVAFSQDGQLLASGSVDKTVRLWDTGSWVEVKRIKGHEQGVKAVAFSPDGQLLASGSNDKTVRLWDPKTGVEVKRLEGHKRWVEAVAFSPNGQLLASGSSDGTVRLWSSM